MRYEHEPDEIDMMTEDEVKRELSDAIESLNYETERLDILTQALYHIKDHMDVVTGGKAEISAVWNIANNALKEADIETRTDNERKTTERK